MNCPSVPTGGLFLERALAHLDCQAQSIGSFGFQALAAPGSPAALALTGLLTLFVAVYGMRLLFGPVDEPRSVVSAVLKIGIVLTLAVSWPAWRVLAYDTVLYGPAEVAATILPVTLPQTDLPRRLQGIDNGIAAITYAGSGRSIEGPTDPRYARELRSTALSDEAGLGWSRPLFLAATLGSLGALRILGGLLLAIAPLIAGLLLFDLTRGLFVGWLRALAFVAIASLGATLLLSIQVAVMEPWIVDVLNRRSLRLVAATAPTEALALVLAFAGAMAGVLFVLARMAFHNDWVRVLTAMPRVAKETASPVYPRLPARPAEIPVHSRALAISESVAAAVRRDVGEAGSDYARRIETLRTTERESAAAPTAAPSAERLGNGYRRNVRRATRSESGRDNTR